MEYQVKRKKFTYEGKTYEANQIVNVEKKEQAEALVKYGFLNEVKKAKRVKKKKEEDES